MPDGFKIRGGLRFEAHPFTGIEATPAPSRVRITTNHHAKLSVKPGDKVLNGQPLQHPDPSFVATHASVSGVVTEVSSGRVSIDSDGMDTVFKHPSLKHSSLDTDLQAHCRSMGLVGLGGAAFPVHRKISKGLENKNRPINTLLVNAAECDPAIYCDEALINARTDQIIKGIELLRKAINASQCIVAIEENKTQACAQLKQHLPEDIKLICVPAIYPSGAENILYSLCTGYKNHLGRDNSICFNIATCYSIYRAVAHSQPLISRVVSVLSDDGIRHFEFRIGTPIRDIAALLNVTRANRIIVNGRMMGHTVDLEYSIEKHTNSLIFENTTQDPSTPCIRCGACAEVCPEALHPQHLHWHSQSHNSEALTALNLNACIECACCDAVCPSHIPLARNFNKAINIIQQETLVQHNADLAKQRYEKRLNRLENHTARQRKQLDEKSTELNQSKSPQASKKELIAKALARRKIKKTPSNRDGADL